MEATEKIDVSVESRILGNIIMSTSLTSRIRGIIVPSAFESKLSKIVAQWVLDFFDRMGKAPGVAIVDIFTQRKQEVDEATRELVGRFLKNCSRSWEPSNEDYAVQMATEYFQRRNRDALLEKLKSKADMDDGRGFDKLIAEYVKPEVRVKKGVDILNDTKFIKHSFNEEDVQLFHLPSGLNKVVGGPICVGDFMTYLAPSKGGKTWWLIFTAMQALCQGCSVLFVSLEMTLEQMTKRFFQYMGAFSRHGEHVEGSYFEDMGNGKWKLKQGETDTTKVPDDENIIASVQKDFRDCGGDIRLWNYPTDELTFETLDADIKMEFAATGFMPEVILIDYLDIMKKDGRDDLRHQLDRIWQKARGYNLSMPCALITASQISGADILNGKRDANRGDMAECKSKQNHVTRMVTINRNNNDKKKGICRLVGDVQRDEAECFDQLVVTQNLACGRPWMQDRFLKDVVMDDDGFKMEGL